MFLALATLTSAAMSPAGPVGFTLREEMDPDLIYDNSNNSSLRIDLLSQNPDDIKFYLYRNPLDEDDRVEMKLNDPFSLYTSGFNFSKPLILLIHGVLSDSQTIHDVQTVKTEYLRNKTTANIIMVDYGPLTVSDIPFIFSTLSFLTILANDQVTNIVGGRVSDFIQYLIIQQALKGPELVHIVGFSVGAHMAGAVGRTVFERTGRKIRRITGLDPSPQFAYRPKLVPTDADFVDVTYTSMGVGSNFKTVGHVMFFINGGGPHQQHCPNFKPFTEIYCSHTTAVYYFTKSIRKKTMMGCVCQLPCLEEPDYCRMPIVYGDSTPVTARGNYYVQA